MTMFDGCCLGGSESGCNMALEHDRLDADLARGVALGLNDRNGRLAYFQNHTPSLIGVAQGHLSFGIWGFWRGLRMRVGNHQVAAWRRGVVSRYTFVDSDLGILAARSPQLEGIMDTPFEELSYVVRYGVTRILGEFTARGVGTLARGTAVIIRSDRGHEWGTVLCTATDQTRTYLGANEAHGRIVRLPTLEDEAERDRLARSEKEAFVGCLDLIRERNMQMQLIDAEQVIGGERLIFYYVSEQRVDFRDLVKGLAKLFHVRIEMRQIGIRDEAKLLADYGDCGQPVCCNTFLREMPPVSMKMAKLQKATLDPSKISGRCGRLKCCLRYEYDTYEEHRKELPPVGATVVTKQGTGRVVGLELLAQKLLVSYEGHRQVMTDAKDILTVVSTKSPKPAPQQHDDHSAEGDSRKQPPNDRRRRENKPRGDSRPNPNPRESGENVSNDSGRQPDRDGESGPDSDGSNED